MMDAHGACVGLGFGEVPVGLSFWTVSLVFMIHRLPDGLSFTCMTMTQENGRFEQCCRAFGLPSFLFFK